MEIRKSESIAKLVAGICAARPQFAEIIRDQENPMYETDYTSLANLINSTSGALAEKGVHVFQIPSVKGREVTITTMICCGDEFLGFDLPLPGVMPDEPERWDPQVVASTITYGRRAGYEGVLSLAGRKDDDGNRGAGRSPDPPCDGCKGSGRVSNGRFDTLCPVCGGGGRERKKKAAGVPAPAPSAQMKLAVGSSNGPFAPPDDSEGYAL